MGNAFGRGGRRPGGDTPPAPGGGVGGGGGDQAGRDRARAFMGEPSPESEALQQAIDSKAAAEELKAKLAKVREARKAKQAKLDKAQDDLRQVLSMRQEAIAVVNGLLN